MSVRCGGDFFYDGSGQDCSGDLLLVAGGVGITPIASIARHAVDLQEKLKKQNKRSSSKKVVLLYSAVETGEFLFEVQCVSQDIGLSKKHYDFFSESFPFSISQEFILSSLLLYYWTRTL